MAFLKPATLLGLSGRRTLFLYHLNVGRGEALSSVQYRMAVLPVVTDEGTLQNGTDGGTVGQNV